MPNEVEDLTIKYPMTIDMKFQFRKGKQIGTATIDGPTGRLPSHDEILQAIANAKSVAEANGFEMPNTPQKLMELLAYDKFGFMVSVPTAEKAFCYADADLPEPAKQVAEEWDDEGDDDEDDEGDY